MPDEFDRLRSKATEMDGGIRIVAPMPACPMPDSPPRTGSYLRQPD